MATRGKDDNEREMARSYVKKNNFKATLAYDPETTAARAFTAFQFPSFYIVDSKGELKTMRVPSVTKQIRKLGFEQFLSIAADGGDIPMIDLVEETSATKDQLILIGKKAPDFTLNDISGKTYKLSSLRGKSVIAVFWNEGCPHCRAELPLLNDYYMKNKSRFNFEILAVTRKGDAGSVKRTTDFISEKKLAFPVLWDNEEPVSNDYKIMYIPTAFFISADGTIVELMVGTPPNFDKALDSIFTDTSRLGSKK
jgi:peroxiredoxin